jgi:carbon starvation protein
VIVTLIPLAWLLSVTFTAGWQKIAHPSPRIGFLAAARDLDAKLPALEKARAEAQSSSDAVKIEAARKAVKANRALHFNNRLNAVVAGTFLSLVSIILLISIREWLLLLRGSKPPRLSETEPVWLPAFAGPEPRQPLHVFGLIAFGCALLKELSGEAALAREQAAAQTCNCVEAQTPRGRQNVYLTATEHRFRGVRRCC